MTRAARPLTQIPQSVQTIERAQISRAKPTWGLDEALANVPGVYAANRYNFSQDQRISIRGFGARSAFAVRGIKVLLDGIPQTLPDGQGQLTNLELGEVDRIEVLRGSASALYGNASGGVISIWTRPAQASHIEEEARLVAGTFDQSVRGTNRSWYKWQSTTGLPIGSSGGSALLTVSRLDYQGERDHSAATNGVLNARVNLPLQSGWSLALLGDVGDNPRADNPGSLTRLELSTNRDTVPLLNRNRHAGKAVTQYQAGATARHQMSNGGEAQVTLFGLARDLTNPITTTYIELMRADYGARASVTYPSHLGALPHRLTAGFDLQRQHDDRKNFNYLNTPGDSAKPDTTRALDQLEHVTEIGPFVQSALELSPRTTLTAGLRYDWVKFTVHDRLITGTNPDNSGARLMRALSGSLGLAVNPASAVTLYGNVGSSFETPTTTELVNAPTGTGGFNPDLQPQQAWNYEVGARGSIGARASYTVAVFQADVRDELVQYDANDARAFYRNAGSARHRGVEMSGAVTIVPALRLNAVWTHADYRYRHYSFRTDSLAVVHTLDGRSLPGVPQEWLHLMARAQAPRAGGLWLELEQTYSSGFFVNDTLSTRTAPWWATAVRVGWDGKVGGGRFSPFVGVNNMFNHLYVSSVVINAARDRYYEPAPRRNFYVGLSVGAGR
ncbi:MAG TPA: TonB-dependent receptor [Gemmatimonadales bacterium]|nr:TonB-dependent receptor [Gemmatimonadales bacterium]